MSEVPFVTVLIPAWNEEADVERCLRAVLAQDHPHDRMEIILVDGGSTDATAVVASRVLAEGDVDWKVLDNPLGTTPSNLNAGLTVASGEILCRVDARSIIPSNYVRSCAQLLMHRSDVVVVGGTQVAIELDNSIRSIGIARALNNTYTMGRSRYRSGAPSGPSDTVYLGAFRCEQLRALGCWDEYFETNQDYELNRRMGRNGLVWFDDRLVVSYVPRKSLAGLWRQYHRFGRWKVRYWKATGDRPQPRQLLPVVGLPVVLSGCVVGVLRSERRLHTAAGIIGPALAALVLVDGIGSAEPAPVRIRVMGGLTAAVVVVGWTAGVARELVCSGVSRRAS